MGDAGEKQGCCRDVRGAERRNKNETNNRTEQNERKCGQRWWSPQRRKIGADVIFVLETIPVFGSSFLLSLLSGVWFFFASSRCHSREAAGSKKKKKKQNVRENRAFEPSRRFSFSLFLLFFFLGMGSRVMEKTAPKSVSKLGQSGAAGSPPLVFLLNSSAFCTWGII